jgi:hypothetical protein
MIVQRFYVECDSCGQTTDVTHISVVEMARIALRNGWEMGRRDLCPSCRGTSVGPMRPPVHRAYDKA